MNIWKHYNLKCTCLNIYLYSHPVYHNYIRAWYENYRRIELKTQPTKHPLWSTPFSTLVKILFIGKPIYFANPRATRGVVYCYFFLTFHIWRDERDVILIFTPATWRRSYIRVNTLHPIFLPRHHTKGKGITLHEYYVLISFFSWKIKITHKWIKISNNLLIIGSHGT